MTPVSRNFLIDRDTRELGEDWKALEAVDQLYRDYLAGVMLARFAVRSKDGRETLEAVEVAIGEMHHDVSWAKLIEDSRQAFADAEVVQIPIRERSTVLLDLVR